MVVTDIWLPWLRRRVCGGYDGDGGGYLGGEYGGRCGWH
jgi:hypothetical protein